jgi:7-cyano-7-deazaguanine synthase
MDSVVAAALQRADGLRIATLSVDYGQRHRVELEAAERLSGWLGAEEHLVVRVDLRAIGGSALTDEIDVPKQPGSGSVPVTYVPARNTVFLSLALGAAEVMGASSIVIGANQVDYSGYPDCRAEVLDAFGRLAALATRAGVEGRAPRIRAPLLDMSKAEIVRRGCALGVPFAETISCYDPSASGAACGSCDACRLRRAGFEDAGEPDPTRYREI